MDNIIDDKQIILDDFNPQEIAKKLAKKMRRGRLMHNLTQEALSGMSGVSLGSLKRFENKNEISLKHLLQLALVLDALEGFNHLFPENEYQSIDDIIKKKKFKERKRGRNA